MQGVLWERGHQDPGTGDHVGPGLVRHPHLQVVGAGRGPILDAKLARVLVQTKQPGGYTGGERREEIRRVEDSEGEETRG